MNALTICGIGGIVALLAANAAPYIKAKLAEAKDATPAVTTKVPSTPMSKEAFVARVSQIIDAAGEKAPDAFKLKHLQLGSDDATVMADRIKELENPPAKEAKPA